ncbi:elongation of very long chain fatty acids protein 7 [Clonorchis sinensis]|uniref:Elongation of very long chain fatty acids protein n=2 Tax=Clonorchis sinensis TaxID=79923 RepID=H2KSS3_CLOSI|nr:elongation of very long chain fatty acids protein 7 [Clonorchis sinensis]
MSTPVDAFSVHTYAFAAQLLLHSELVIACTPIHSQFQEIYHWVDHNMGTPEEKIWERLAGAVLPPHPDPRTDAYPLMGSWPPTALISLAYVVGVYAWRNELLKKRCKVQQKSTKSSATITKDTQTNSWGFVKCLMVLYNFIMVLYSAYMVIGTLRAVSKLGYGLGCEAQPDPNDRQTDSLLYFGYLFYFSKFVEMLDTVFFLWRGKVDQVTFLHVFHHATMPPSIWWGVRYAPGGIVYTFLVANSFIHVIMYTYYGMAAAGLYKYLWWKNYLTIAQMIQFVFLIVHQSQIFLRSTPCNYPKVFPAAIIFYASVFLVLFGNFYVQAYWRKQRLAKRIQRATAAAECTNGTKPMANGHVVQNGTVTSNGYVPNGDQVRARKRHD